MRSNSRNSLELLTLHLNTLRETAENACVVVEGKNDELVLRRLGVSTAFYHVCGSGKPIFELANDIANEKEAIILTDFDKKGRQLASKIVQSLNGTAKKVKINLQIRRNLMSAMREIKIAEVEDLESLLEKLQAKNGKFRGA